MRFYTLAAIGYQRFGEHTMGGTITFLALPDMMVGRERQLRVRNRKSPPQKSNFPFLDRQIFAQKAKI